MKSSRSACARSYTHNAYIHTCTQTHTHTHAQTHTHTRTHTHLFRLFLTRRRFFELSALGLSRHQSLHAHILTHTARMHAHTHTPAHSTHWHVAQIHTHLHFALIYKHTLARTHTAPVPTLHFLFQTHAVAIQSEPPAHTNTRCTLSHTHAQYYISYAHTHEIAPAADLGPVAAAVVS